MLKRFLLGIIIAAILAAPACPDLLLPGEFRDRKTLESAATFTLSPAQDKSSAVELAINAEVEGYYYYAFSVVSGDTQERLYSAEISCSDGNSKCYISLPVHEEGQVSHYLLSASFIPEFRYRRKYNQVRFSRTLTVRNVNGIPHVIIEN